MDTKKVELLTRIIIGIIVGLTIIAIVLLSQLGGQKEELGSRNNQPTDGGKILEEDSGTMIDFNPKNTKITNNEEETINVGLPNFEY